MCVDGHMYTHRTRKHFHNPISTFSTILFVVMGFRGSFLQILHFYHIGYLELKLTKKQPMQGHPEHSLPPWKQKIKLPCGGYPPCSRRKGGILLNRERNLKPRRLYKQSLVTILLIQCPKPKLRLINSSQTYCFFVLNV